MLLSIFQKNKPLVLSKGLFYIVLRFSFFFIFFHFINSYAQKEDSFWILDDNYALDFKDVQNPKVINNFYGSFWRDGYESKISSTQSICDKNGELLFYTDGNFVWNKNRQMMPNGTLAGHSNLNTPNPTSDVIELARAIIIPNLNNEFQYFIVVNDHIRQLNTYSMIDMRLNNGNGDVIIQKKMKPFTNGNYYTDFRATGVDSCRGIWLIGAAKNSYKQLSAFKVGAEEISNNPIFSTLKYNPVKYYFKTARCILSERGSLIAVTDASDGTASYIYKFDQNTGFFNSNPSYTLDINNISISGIYSNFNTNLLFFSSNQSSLFFGRMNNSFTKLYILSFSLIDNKFYIIDSLTESDNRFPYCMKAIDGKAYLSLNSNKKTGLGYPYHSTTTSHNLAVINNPDGVGTNVGYDFNGITFPGDAFPRVPYQGLVNYYGRPKPRPRITLPTQQICSQTPFSLSADVSNLPQVQSGKQIWYLNDTEVISYNPNDSYTIQEPGVYKLSFRHEECIEHTTITVTTPPVHNIPPKDSLCEGKFLQLTSTGILQIKNQLNLPILPPVSVTGNYTFTVLGCNSLLGSFGLKVIPKPNLNLPNTIAGCLPLGVQLQPVFNSTLGQNLLWSNGSTIPYQSITTSGIFTITVSNRCFAEQKSTQITFQTIPILPKFPSDTTICESKNITILGNQNLQALEQSSNKTYFSNNNILLLTQAGIYTISQSNTCHTSTGVLGISEILKPNLTLPNTLAGCLPLGVQLQPVFNSTLGQNLLWSNGSTIPYQTITTSGIFTITVSNRCFAEQKSTQITFQTKPILPKFPSDTTICEGKNITILGNQNLQALEQSSNKTYFSNNNILLLTQAGIYTISQSNACHTTTGNMVINTDNFPVFIVPKDTVICDSTSFSFAAIRNKNANTSLIWKDGSTENYRSISQPGNYEITVKNSCGEFKKAFNITFASSKIGFKNTNIFTPNGDNSNDEWQPTTESSEAYKLEIFNRQGTKVFQSEQWNESWQAQSQPDGIYFYHISYLDCNQQTKSLKGWVEVRR